MEKTRRSPIDYEHARSHLSCVLVLATPAFARESTDVIVMKNGDRLTGEIKGLNAGVLYMSIAYILGTSSVQWSKVARLESKQLFLVKTEDGSVYTGTLSTKETASGRPTEITVVETSAKSVIESPRIVQMDMTSKKFFQRFNGDIDTGILYSKGNESTQYSLASQLSWNASFYGNWDSRPPPGLSGSDYGSSSGLSWTFGNK